MCQKPWLLYQKLKDKIIVLENEKEHQNKKENERKCTEETAGTKVF